MNPTTEMKIAFLRYSRAVLESGVRNRRPTGVGERDDPVEPDELARDPWCQKKRGLFVTLRKGGDLRGCIGHIEPRLPLLRAVAEITLKSALDDYRFPPVTEDELPEIRIEISILTEPRSVPGADDIRIGTDGVILSSGGRSAVFLPQVAAEQGWNLSQTLTALSRKAGLPPAEWRSDSARFQTFQAVYFNEIELGLIP